MMGWSVWSILYSHAAFMHFEFFLIFQFSIFQNLARISERPTKSQNVIQKVVENKLVKALRTIKIFRSPNKIKIFRSYRPNTTISTSNN